MRFSVWVRWVMAWVQVMRMTRSPWASRMACLSASSWRVRRLSCHSALSASMTRWWWGQRKSGTIVRPSRWSGTLTCGGSNPALRMRSRTASSSSLLVGAWPVARILVRLAMPGRGPRRSSVSRIWGIVTSWRWASRTVRLSGLVVQVRGEVDQGAGGGGDRDALVVGAIDHRRAMDSYAPVRSNSPRRHLGVAVLPAHEPVQGGGRDVAEDGGGAAGLDGREERALLCEVRVAHGVNPAVKGVEMPIADA